MVKVVVSVCFFLRRTSELLDYNLYSENTTFVSPSISPAIAKFIFSENDLNNENEITNFHNESRTISQHSRYTNGFNNLIGSKTLSGSKCKKIKKSCKTSSIRI